jgi:hypothetical protein
MDDMTPEEARDSLAAIQQAGEKTRGLYGYNGYYLITWGLVWFFGFLASQFTPPKLLGWLWGPLVVVGWIVSAALGIYQGKQVRSVLGARIGFFFLALFGFAILWFIILEPLSVRQGILFLITIITFGGTVAGVFTRSLATIVSCAVITALAVVGYYVLTAYFDLWIAVVCGLPMVINGLIIRLRWR